MTFPANWIPYVNIALLILLVVFIIAGYIRGFFVQLIDIVAYILAFFVAKRYSQALSGRFHLWPEKAVMFEGTILQDYIYDKCNYYAWFVLLFLGVLLLLLILKPLIKLISEIPFIKETNKALGMVLGVISFLIWTCIAVYILSTPIFTNGQEVVDQTFLKPIREVSSVAFHDFQSMLEENGILQKLLSMQEEDTGEDVSNEEIDKIIDFFTEAGMNYQEVKNTIYHFLGKE